MTCPEIALARSAQEKIESYSAEIETQSRVPDALIRELNLQGLFAMTIPQMYGGGERDALDTLTVIEQLSYADSAVGWSGMIYSTTGMLGAMLPDDWAEVVYRVQRSGEQVHSPITAGAAAPSGRATVVEGGVEVTGRWAWGSGTHHCDWICGGTLVVEGDDIRRFDDGSPMVHVMFFEKDEVKLHDNWNTSGLRGTGSVDFEVTEQFVPEGRWTVLGGSHRRVDSLLYRFPFFGFFATAVASVPLGIARRAVDDFAELSQGKIPALKTSTINESSYTQLEFGRAESLVEGARHYLHSIVEEVWQRLDQGDSLSLDDKRKLRLAATQSTLMCAEAVDILYNAAGGSSLHAHCSMQRHFRDIHAATQHRMVSPEMLMLAGAARLSSKPPHPQL